MPCWQRWSVTWRLKPNLEAAEFFLWVLPHRLYIRHPGGWRSHPDKCQRALTLFPLALEDGLDAPVGKILHPSRQPKAGCRLSGGLPKEDALNNALDPDVKSCHIDLYPFEEADGP